MNHIPTHILMARLWREHIRGYLAWLLGALIFMAIMAGANTLSAYLMKPMVNKIFLEKNEDMLWWVAIAIVITFLVKGTANFVQTAMMSHVGLKLVADMQNRLFVHMSHLDLNFFHNNSTGALLSRFTIDVGSIRIAVTHGTTVLGKDLFSLFGLVGLMFYLDWELAFVAFFVFPIAIIPIAKIGRRMRKVTVNAQAETGLLTSTLEQTFQGIRIVKAYSMEEYERGRVASLVESLYKLAFKQLRTRAISSPIMETLGGIAVALVIAYGGYRVIHQEADPGSFFAFITALLMAYEPLKRLTNLNATLQEGLAGAQRTFLVLDSPSDIVEKADAEELHVAQGEVRFENVHFSYAKPEDNDSVTETALNGIDITVPAGKMVALVGASGAGKSTIMNLVPRFYDVTQGRVLVDGRDVRDVTFKSLRSAMALVSQEVTLFDDTVLSNIAYGRPDASFDEIVQAAKNAAAHDFIEALPQGYETKVGEHGVRLSGGQRQRLAIARAMLKNAPILLLDEATSALDTESERHVQSALEGLMKDRTTLVIAHRLSTVVDADLIYVLEQGRVIEQGTHTELLARGGQYATLYQLQFAAEEAEGVPEDTPVEA